MLFIFHIRLQSVYLGKAFLEMTWGRFVAVVKNGSRRIFLIFDLLLVKELFCSYQHIFFFSDFLILKVSWVIFFISLNPPPPRISRIRLFAGACWSSPGWSSSRSRWFAISRTRPAWFGAWCGTRVCWTFTCQSCAPQRIGTGTSQSSAACAPGETCNTLQHHVYNRASMVVVVVVDRRICRKRYSL